MRTKFKYAVVWLGMLVAVRRESSPGDESIALRRSASADAPFTAGTGDTAPNWQRAMHEQDAGRASRSRVGHQLSGLVC